MDDRPLITRDEYYELRADPDFTPGWFTVSLSDFARIHCDQKRWTLPPVHERICDWLESTHEEPLRLLFCHRELGKSYLTSLYIAWTLFIDPQFTFIAISSTEKLSRRNAFFIRQMIETHPLTMHLVPDEGDKATIWQKQSFTIKRPDIDLNPTCTVTSVKGDFIGLHSVLALSDDAETDKNTATPEGAEEVERVVASLSDLSSRQLFLGTPYRSNSIYRGMVTDPEFKVLEIPAYTEDHEGKRTYSWPEKFNDKEIAYKKRNKTEAFFRSQYLLEFVDVNTATLPTEFITTYPEEPTIQGSTITLHGQSMIDAVAGWDPATSLPDADDSVLAIAYRNKDDRNYLHRVEKLPPIDKDVGWDRQVKRVVDLCVQCGVTKLVIETNVAKGLPAQVRQEIAKRKVKLNVIDHHVTGAAGSKVTRIASVLEHVMGDGRLWVHRTVHDGDLISQCRQFPDCVTRRRAKDDFIDAAAIAMGHLKRVPKAFLEGRGVLTHQLVRGGRDRLDTRGANERFSMRRGIR